MINRPSDLPNPAEAEKRLCAVQQRFEAKMSELPNMPAAVVAAGGKEADVVVQTWGHRLSLEPVPRWEAASRLGLVDFQRGAKLSG